MKKNLVVGIVGCLIGFAAGYSTFGIPSPDMKTESGMNMNESGHTAENTEMHHATLEVDPKKPVPSVSLEAITDTKDGYNIHIKTTNFTFTPEKAGAAPVPNEGHAHLYINGTKIARIYGPWFYAGSSLFKDGDNVVQVTLNANDHSEWVAGETHIDAEIIVKK